jgi:hypothetical protein
MRVVKLKENKKYGDFDVAEVYDNDFCVNNSDWAQNGAPTSGAEPGEQYLVIPDDSDIAVGWSYDGTTYHGEITLARAKAGKLAEIAEKRYNAVNKDGLTIDGIIIDTDPEARIAVQEAQTGYAANGTLSAYWKGRNGLLPLTPAKFTELVTKVLLLKSVCFAKEFDLTAVINTATTIEQVEAVEWTTPPVVIPN